MLFADIQIVALERMYIHFIPVIHVSASTQLSLKYVKSHWYPKSTIDIQSLLLSLQVTLWALKRLENCPFFAQSQTCGRNNGRSRKKGRAGRAGRAGQAGALRALKMLENCPFFTQSRKWGQNNERSRKRRESRKSGKSGTRQQKVRKHRRTKGRSLEEAD